MFSRETLGPGILDIQPNTVADQVNPLVMTTLSDSCVPHPLEQYCHSTKTAQNGPRGQLKISHSNDLASKPSVGSPVMDQYGSSLWLIEAWTQHLLGCPVVSAIGIWGFCSSGWCLELFFIFCLLLRGHCHHGVNLPLGFFWFIVGLL